MNVLRSAGSRSRSRTPDVQRVLAWVVLGAAVLVEFPALARLGRAFAWLLTAPLMALLAPMLLGPQPAGCRRVAVAGL